MQVRALPAGPLLPTRRGRRLLALYCPAFALAVAGVLAGTGGLAPWDEARLLAFLAVTTLAVALGRSTAWWLSFGSLVVAVCAAADGGVVGTGWRVLTGAAGAAALVLLWRLPTSPWRRGAA